VVRRHPAGDDAAGDLALPQNRLKSSRFRQRSGRGARTFVWSFDTKAEAEDAGRKTAKREETEHLIHKGDGEISERSSYGNDPFPPAG
jgi:hypothetical protein